MEYLIIRKKNKLFEKIELKKFIENNSVFLKKTYLHYVFLLENTIIDNKKITEKFYYKNDYSLWNMCVFSEKNIYKYDSIVEAIKFIALIKIFEKYKNHEIYLKNFDENLVTKIRESYYFSNKRLFFENIKKSNNFERKNIKRIFLENFFFSILFFLRNLKNNFSFGDQKNIFKNFKKKDIFVISYFTHFSQADFKKEIFNPLQWGKLFDKKRISFNYFQIFIPSIEFKKFSKLNSFLAKKKINGLNRDHFINHFIDLKTIFLTIYDFFKIRKKLKVSYFEKKINNPIVRDIYKIQSSDLKISLGGSILLENLFWINIFDKILKKIPKQKLAIYLYENQPWEDAFIKAWRLYGHGKLIGYTPTTVNFWHLNYFNHKLSNKIKLKNDKNFPDLIACSSETAFNFFKGSSIPIKKLRKVESLRYNEIKKNNYENKSKKNFLILGDYKKEINKNMLEILSSAISKFKLYDKYNFYFKPHPAALVPQNLLKNFIIKNEDDLIFLLKKCKNVICSNSTSALIECYEYGNNVFLFDDIKTLDFSPIKGIKKFEFIKSFNDSEGFYKILNSKQPKKNIKNFFYKDKKLSKWSKILRQFDF